MQRGLGCFGFCREAYTELLRRGFTGDQSFSGRTWNIDLKTDPVALALFDEKGTDWCSNSPGAPRGARMLPFVKMKKQAVPARFADFVEVEVLNDGANEHVWVNFDKALRCGIDKILDNGGTAMDDDARAWTAIINSYERAWPDCGASAMSDSRMTGCL